MSFDTHTSRDADHNSVVTYRRNDPLGPAIHYTSSIFVNIQQLQHALVAQHQHEKEALNELNHRLAGFVDRVQLLESQNAKYMTDVAELRRQSSGDSGIDVQWNERYLNMKSDLSSLHYSKADCESDFEWYQLQIGIYQQLIDAEQQWRDKRLKKLDHELKQIGSDLSVLRTSYADLERTAANQYGERDNVLKQYLSLTHDWCNIHKQRKRWNMSIDTLKSYIAFYKRIRSHSTRNVEAISINMDDLSQFWTLELDKSIQKIRHDFEVFYASIYREMTAYYETKTDEVRREVERASQEPQDDGSEFALIIQTLQADYEKYHNSLSYEKEMQMKLEKKYAQLEAELKSLEGHYEEKLEVQGKEAFNLQETIMQIAYDINEMQRSKVHLEAEIIVYRYLLDNSQSGGRVIVTQPKPNYESGMSGKLVAKSRKKKSIGIKECAVNGKYIVLLNHSTSKDIDLGRWVIKQRTDAGPNIRYVIPDGVRLQHGKELKIYSKLGAETANQSAISALVQYQLVNNDLSSWGVGNMIETILFNQDGDEEALYSQNIEFRKNNM
ncbi:unnamed protein product [Adineta ricciae]|uniref:LTD domain-containing protein n=1 Tax=Adineta ricciae TaxID=249248 RepID=A0A813ZUJ2_ADIRI|nr:unnamed protein product [Adineta ricciae]CAF1059623.1 unnamed protein product [Adineta ricciae]